MILVLAAVLVLSFLISLNAVPRLMRWAWRTGFLDLPGPRKIHAQPVPYGGGIGVAWGVLLPVLGAVAYAFLHVHAGLPIPRGLDHKYVQGVVREFPRLMLLAGGAVAVLYLGLIDDRRKLGAWTKLGAQTAVALAMALFYERLDLFGGAPALSVALTVLWIVGVTNAFNLLDHMDGLCAGVTVITGSCFLAVAVLTEQYFIAAFLAAIVGSCLAFLLFNFPPAKVFLGDGGSLLVGFLLATLTVSFTFYDYKQNYLIYRYAVPILILSVPLYDTSSVVWRRIQEGRSPFDADRNHFAHRLLALGLSRRATVLTIYALTLVTGLAAVLLYEVEQTGAVVILAQTVVIFAIIAVLDSRGRVKNGGTQI